MQVQALKHNNEYSFKDAFLYFLCFVGRAFVIALSFLFVIIFLFTCALIGDTMYNLNKGRDVVPLFGGYVIVTQSMVPTIKVNDAVIVRRSEKDELEIGDIITFKSNDIRYNGLIITHRIVGTQEISNGHLVYRTKGDNNLIEDSSVVDESSIYGKVILKIPKLGYIQNFLKTKLGFSLFVIIPILIIVIINLKDIIRRKVEESEV